MSHNFKTLFIVLILSFPFWWGVNLLEKDFEEIFAWNEISQNPQLLTAQISLEQQLRDLKPIRNKSVEDLILEAESALSIFIDEKGKERVLYEKDSEKKLPIASLTKLMTAKIVIDNYDLSKKITVSKEAVLQEEDFGKLQIGKVFEIKYLLYPLLIESSNDAAFSLANDYEGMDVKEFVNLMNKKAFEMKLKDTFFVNPTGLDPEKNEPKTKINYSTSKDLASLAKSLLDVSLIWEILSTKNFNQYGPELENTNKLLDEVPGTLGGKTGYTKEAGKCMILVLKAPKNKGHIINIVLGSFDNFVETKKLAEWTRKAYKW